ncbi:MAG: response regulator transcription factor [Myxococcales bacterium]|nr:response regulator transcription factor [Myxococcales bacterium]
MKRDTIRVVLVDDHAVLRVGLRAFLEERTSPRFVVLGEASRGEDALELVETLRPDVLLLDLSLEGMGGLETTLELRRREVPVKVLVLTQHAESVYLKRLLEAGANGYILKSARGEQLVGAIESVVEGGTYVDPSLAAALVNGTASSAVPATDEEALARLTPRERQVLLCVAEGKTNKEIARALDVAIKTVMTHRANMMDKVGIHNRSKLVQFAIRTGLLTT